MNKAESSRLAKNIAEDCTARRVRLLNRVITSLYDRALQPLGIKINQVTMLVILTLRKRVTPSDICTALLMDKSTVSRNLGRLQKKGWIKVTEDSSSKDISITPKGRKLLSAVYCEWTKAQKKADELLGEAGVEAVRNLHDRLKQR